MKLSFYHNFMRFPRKTIHVEVELISLPLQLETAQFSSVNCERVKHINIQIEFKRAWCNSQPAGYRNIFFQFPYACVFFFPHWSSFYDPNQPSDTTFFSTRTTQKRV